MIDRSPALERLALAVACEFCDAPAGKPCRRRMRRGRRIEEPHALRLLAARPLLEQQRKKRRDERRARDVLELFVEAQRWAPPDAEE